MFYVVVLGFRTIEEWNLLLLVFMFGVGIEIKAYSDHLTIVSFHGVSDWLLTAGYGSPDANDRDIGKKESPEG